MPFNGCLVTTRQELPELKARLGAALVQQPLDRLSSDDGVALLRELEIKGPGRELREAVEAYHGHTYSLTLLGTFLHEATDDHDIRRRHDFPLLDEEGEHDHHARHIFETYEKHLGSKSPEIAVLRLLGFFDRPAARELIDVLRASEKDDLRDIVRSLTKLRDTDWQRVLTRLTGLRLLSVADDGSLDSHPLLREYFATQLRTQFPKAFRAGHHRLYEHLTKTTEHRPDTLAGLQPLYQAVRHGCLAGMQAEARRDVYLNRILRGNEFYSSKKLGAVGANLGAVACFFEEPWCCLSPNLSELDQAWLFNEVAIYLKALGRLTDALEPMRAAVQWTCVREMWKEAAVGSSNMSELELTLGLVADAVVDGERSVDFADRSWDAFWMSAARTYHADALYQAGRREEALALLQEAEAMQAEHQPGYPRLYSLQGFRYCDLLLDEVEIACSTASRQPGGEDRQKGVLRTVAERAKQTLKLATEAGKDILSAALDHLTIARVELFRALLFHSPLATCFQPISEAVDGLRAAGRTDYLPRGLLARAWARFAAGDESGCREDLDEAWEIAERGPMKLHMADIQLYRARFFHDPEALQAAAALIEETGYHRRDEELADLQRAFGLAQK